MWVSSSETSRSCRGDVAIVGLLHRGVVYGAPSSYQIIDADDIFIIEADPGDLKEFVDATGLHTRGGQGHSPGNRPNARFEGCFLVEAIVGPDSPAQGRTARGLHLHAAFGVNCWACPAGGPGSRRGSAESRGAPATSSFFRARRSWCRGRCLDLVCFLSPIVSFELDSLARS